MYQYGTNRSDFLEGKAKNYEWVSLGASFMLSEINAAFLYSQLQEVEKVTAKRKKNWESYYEHLLPLQKELKIELSIFENEGPNYHTFFIVLSSMELTQKLIDFMQSNQVQCTAHYAPLHQSNFVKTHFANQTSLPNTDYFSECLLRLPLFYNLTTETVTKISGLIKQFFETH